MKKIILCFCLCVAFGFAFVRGIEKEAERQCEVALDMCEKYPDSCRDVDFYCGV